MKQTIRCVRDYYLLALLAAVFFAFQIAGGIAFANLP
jgi:hypothetical protein